MHVCGGGKARKVGIRGKRRTVKRIHLGFNHGNLPQQSALLYMSHIEVLKDGSLASSMHPIISKH